MIEFLENVQPIFVLGNRGRPEFIDQTDANFAVLTPALDGIDEEYIPPALANSYEKVVISFEVNRLEAWVHIGKTSRNIPPHKPLLKALCEMEPFAGLRADQINVIHIAKDILRLVKSTLIRKLPEVSPTRHTNARLASRHQNPGFARVRSDRAQHACLTGRCHREILLFGTPSVPPGPRIRNFQHVSTRFPAPSKAVVPGSALLSNFTLNRIAAP